MNFPDDPFITSLIARLIQPGDIGLALVGSYARGQNTPYSDVDIGILSKYSPLKLIHSAISMVASSA